MIKKIFMYLIIFICVFASCVGCITLSAAIPGQYIQENSKKSAEYYAQNGKFEETLVKDSKNTIIDNYADSILLNIIYCLDSSEPLKSSVCAQYYSNKEGNVLESYKEVTSDKNLKGNRYYSRYWHGTMTVLKPLLIITDIHGIRIFNIILLIVLSAVLGILLIRQKEIILCISLLVGMFVCGIYIVPLCIEYMSAFAVMLTGSICTVLAFQYKEKYIGAVFLVCGMFICFFDFLTSETLTFTVPALIGLVLGYRKGMFKKFKDGALFILKSGILWSCGYAFMFVSKWALSSVFLKGQAIHEAVSNASYRINAIQNHEAGLGNNRIFKNFVCLNIFDNTSTYGDILGRILIISAVIFVIVYLYKKKKIEEHELFKCLFFIMIIPYARYMALINHSEIHYFFTYRAQMPVIAAGIYMILSSIDFKFIKKFKKKIKR